MWLLSPIKSIIMNPIATAIKTIVEGQGLIYLRSVNINDLNEQVGNTNLAAGAGVYSSLPEIENLRNAGGSVTANTTIEVYYLKPNAEVDDRGEAIDVILDELRPFADGFFDQIKKEAFMSLSVDIEGYDLDAIETLKLTKEVLTGWRIRMVLPIDRTTYYCG